MDRQPVVDRPGIPAEYGTSKATDFIPWDHIEDRLTTERVYWVVTVGRGGRPRVRPIDGLYVDGAIYVGGSPQTAWVADLATNSHVAVHLNGLDEVVIVEGAAEVLPSADTDLAERLAAASNAKFPEYRMTAGVYRKGGAIRIRPRKVIAWTDISRDPTRFRFAESQAGEP
jgi:hypothetical protein